MADILTTGSFTRDEWNNLLDLFITSATSALCCAQNFSLTSCTRTKAKRIREQKGDNRIVATSKPTTMNLAVSVSTSSSTVHSPIAHCIEKPGDSQSTLSNRLVKYRETCPDRRRPGTPELSWRIGEYVETRRFRKLGNRMQWQSLATQSPCYNKLCAAHEEGFSIVRQRYGCSPTDRMKNLVMNTAIWSFFYVCHSSSCSSSRKRLHRKSGVYQESLLEIFETFSSDSEVVITDQTEGTGLTTIDWQQFMWRDDSVNWQSCSICNCQNLRLFWLSAMSGRYPWRTSQKHGKAASNGSWKHVMSKIRIGSTQNKWSSSGHISQDSPHWEFSTRFKRWWLTYSVNQSNSKEVSSSCHSTLTLICESEETKKILFRVVSELLSMLEDSRKDTGRCLDLVPRRNGTQFMSTNRMDSGIKLLKVWCSTLPKADIPYSVLRRKWWNRWIDSSHWYFRQSALCLRSSGRFV